MSQSSSYLLLSSDFFPASLLELTLDFANDFDCFVFVERLGDEVVDQAAVLGARLLVVGTGEGEPERLDPPAASLPGRPEHLLAVVPVEHVVDQPHHFQRLLRLLRFARALRQEAQELPPVPQASQLHVEPAQQSLVHLQDVRLVVQIHPQHQGLLLGDEFRLIYLHIKYIRLLINLCIF